MGHGFGMNHDAGPGLTMDSDDATPAGMMSQNDSFLQPPWNVGFDLPVAWAGDRYRAPVDVSPHPEAGCGVESIVARQRVTWARNGFGSSNAT
ncbi:MAG TPA: hypothetical protein VMR43_13320 [Variovorax sp.]|nr:hypothetical protein [Variovorax sp.]